MPPTPISFARGAPAPDLVPAAELAECAYAVARREGSTLFAYGPGGGYAPLREWVAARHGVDARRVVLTVGGLQGFAFYAAEQLERRPGRVLVEAPSYDRPLKILARERAEIVALRMDDEGLDPDALEAELRGHSEPPSFLYTIPTFQNPSGRSLSTERRRRIVEIAVAHRLAVLEDDPYGLVRFEGDAQPSLHDLEGGELVSYTSSFSKTVAPGLRTGYFVLPADTAASFEERAVSTYISPPLPRAGRCWRVHRPRALRAQPRACLRGAACATRRDDDHPRADASLPGSSWSRPQGGYFVWVELPDGVTTAELMARAERAGVAFVRGEDFFPRGSGLGRSSARLAFSYESSARIVEGVERLAALVMASTGSMVAPRA